jgi:hypothetical protein
MPKMNGTGPEGKGPKTGRGLGRGRKNPGNEDTARPGRGSGKGRQNSGGRGQGKRLQGGSQK